MIIIKVKHVKRTILGKSLEAVETAIVGGGIAGLSLGFFMKKKGIPFTIYEKRNRVGGILGSSETNFGIAEQAGNGFLYAAAIDEMAQTLGLDMIKANGEKKARYILRNGEMKKMPLSFGQLIRAAQKTILPKNKIPLTVRDFGELYFGKTFTDYLLEPGLIGIYGGLGKELGFEAVLKNTFVPLIADNKSLLFQAIKKALFANKAEAKPKGLYSFKGGMQELITALEQHLEQHIQINTAVENLEELSEKQIILCTPAYVSENLVNRETAEVLAKIKYNPFISCTLILDKNQLPKFKEGFGCLLPRPEGFATLGILFNSCIFNYRVKSENHLSLTCILRDFDGKLFEKTEAELLVLLKKEFQQIFGMTGGFIDSTIFKWQQGIPLYEPAMPTYWEELESSLSSKQANVRLFGNYTGEISIRGMCDAAMSQF